MSRSRSRSCKSMSRMKFKFPEVVRILSGAFFEESAVKSFPQDKRQGILWLGHHLQMNSSGTSLPYFISSSSPLLKNKQNSLKLTKETSIIQWNNYSGCSSLCSCENPFFEQSSQARCFLQPAQRKCNLFFFCFCLLGRKLLRLCSKHSTVVRA